MFCFLVFFSLFLVVCCIVFCYIVHLVLAEVDIEPKPWFYTAFGLQAGISFHVGTRVHTVLLQCPGRINYTKRNPMFNKC